MSNHDAQRQALALLDNFKFEPTSLVAYQSAGKVLALGEAEALQKCSDLPAALDLEQISSADCTLQISGYLGAYVVEVTDQHEI